MVRFLEMNSTLSHNIEVYLKRLISLNIFRAGKVVV